MRYTPSTKKRIVILRPRKIDGCLFRIPILNLHVSYPEYFMKNGNFSINCLSPLVIKCKRADCLSVLVSLKKNQRISNPFLKHMINHVKIIVIKGLVTVFSLDSLSCEFQIFYILLSVGESNLSSNTPELLH